MSIITPDVARAHLRVGSAVGDDQLGDLIAAAEQLVADELGRPLVDQVSGWWPEDQVPANVRHAVKLVITDLYENRCTPLAELTGVRILIQRYVKVSVA